MITMTSRISSGLYHMKTRDFDYEAAHLYEHMLIQTFINTLPEHGISQFFFGWISGETFRDFMFINYNFYDSKVESLFRRFMKKDGRIDFSMIDNQLVRIQVEDLSVINKIDSDKLVAELKRIDAAPFYDHSGKIVAEHVESSKAIPSQIIEMHPSKPQFSHVVISFAANNLTLDEKLAFLRLTPIIYDATDLALFSIGLYQNHVGPLSDNNNKDGMTTSATYTTLQNSNTPQQLRDAIQNSLDRLANDISKYSPQIKQYINCFKDSTEWSDSPLDYYRHSGVLTSRSQIVAAFTTQNILSILSKVDVKCRIVAIDDLRTTKP